MPAIGTEINISTKLITGLMSGIGNSEVSSFAGPQIKPAPRI